MSTVETDVTLDADGGPVFRAFDQIEARMKGIQRMVDAIVVRSKAAADAFGGTNLQTVKQLNQVISTLEKFETNVKKHSPDTQSDKAWQDRKKQIDEESKAERKLADDKEKAYAELSRREKADADRKRREEESAFARRERANMSAEQKAQRLAEQRAKTEIAGFERQRREEERAAQQKQRAADAMRPKTMREDMRAEVEAARSLRDLENQRALAANRISEARRRLGQGTTEEDRALHNIITQERERLRLAEARVKAEVQPGSNASINRAMNVDEARMQERFSARTMMSLGAAKSRQAQLEQDIVNRIRQSRDLSGEELKIANNQLAMDKARLAEITKRVTALQREADAEKRKNDAKAKAAEREAAPAAGGDGGTTQPKRRGIFGTLGSIVGRTAAYGGAAAAIYGTISMLRDGVGAAIAFEDEMAKIGAVAGLTAQQQDKLAESIRTVAAGSRFATDEIEAATMVLAQAGFSASDIGNSLQQVANLATAAGTSFQEATDIVTGAIGAFQLQTTEAGHIADVLSGALNTTKLNIQQVALGIQYAGATAYENKMSFDELTASMATMAQAGIRSGSTIGTGLRQFLVDLQTPTKKMAEEFKRLGITMEDVDVKTLGLPEVLNRLASAGFSGASAYGTLETRAAAAYMVLKNNQDTLNEQIVLQNSLGSSAEAAAKGQDSLAAEWQQFKNQVNETMADNSKGFLGWIQEVLRASNELNADAGLRKLEADLAKLEEGSDAWNSQTNAIQEYKENLYSAIEAEGAHAAELDAAKTKVNEANEAYEAAMTTIDASSDAIGRLIQRETTLRAEKGALNAETASLMNRFDGLSAQLVGLADNYDNLLTAMRGVRMEAISFGALRASEQYMGLAQQNQAERSHANSLSGYIMSRDLKNKAPANIQQAIERLARNQNGPTAGRDANLVFNYASQHLTGGDQRALQGWARSISRIGIGNSQLDKARTNVDVMTHLGSAKGQSLYRKIDEMPTWSMDKQKAFLKELNDNAVDPHNSTSKRGAYEFLAQQATAKIGSGEGPRAPEEKEKKKRGGGAAERAQNRRDATILRNQLKAAQAQLDQALKGMLDPGSSSTVDADGNPIIVKSRTLTNDQFKKNLDRVDKSMDDWISFRTKQVEEEISSQKMSPDESKQMMDALAQEIDAKKEDTARKVADGIVGALNLMIDVIEEASADAEAEADHALGMAQARMNALSRSNLAGRVPDYVEQTYQRSLDRAKDDRDKTQIGINDEKLSRLSKELATARDRLQEVTDRYGQYTSETREAQKAVDELSDQVRDLGFANQELRASFGGEGLIPPNFNEQLKMAVENFRQVNHLTASFGEMISMNLTDALGTAQSSLEGFLTEATDGTTGVIGAWGNMTRSLIQYLKQLLIKMIAVKLMQMALGAFGSPTPSPSAGLTGFANTMDLSLGSGLGVTGTVGNFYGGKAFTGRYVTEGVPSRDSVNMKVAKGEFITRKSAVDSVGVDFMRDLNNRGAAAVRAMRPNVIPMPKVDQKMNVYVVSPDEKPTLGPNDVLVVLANDIARGGISKQLIKQVSQGA